MPGKRVKNDNSDWGPVESGRDGIIICLFFLVSPMIKLIRYPLVICYIAMEAMAIEIVSFPINSMVIFEFVM